jgi:hypothetical protein
MHRTRHATTFLLFAVAIATTAALAQEQFTLQYRLAKGKAYRFADTSLVKSSQEVMGQEMKSTATVISTTRLVPSEITDDGTTVLTVSPDAMSIAVKSTRMDTTLVMTDMIGKRTRLTISKLGETIKKEIIDTVKLTGLAAQAGGRQDMIRLHVMPSKPLKIGEKWTATKPETTDAMGGRMITLSTGDFTLVAKESRMGIECVKISYAGKLTISGKGSMNGADFFVEGNGTTSGIYFVDIASGMPVLEDSKYDVESTVALTGAQNMTIPNSSSVTAHRVLLKD